MVESRKLNAVTRTIIDGVGFNNYGSPRSASVNNACAVECIISKCGRVCFLNNNISALYGVIRDILVASAYQENGCWCGACPNEALRDSIICSAKACGAREIGGPDAVIG